MMSQEDIEKMLDKIGIEYRYHHFETEEAVDPPFICYLFRKTENVAADGKVYEKVSRLDIELYTDMKDIETEMAIETILDSRSIFYNKSETYIETEKLYEVLYEMEV